MAIVEIGGGGKFSCGSYKELIGGSNGNWFICGMIIGSKGGGGGKRLEMPLMAFILLSLS